MGKFVENPLSKKIKELNRKERWTQRENKGIDGRSRNFIRQIQVLFKVDKEKAKEIFGNYRLEGKAAFGKLEKRIKKNIDSYYPKHPASTSKSGKLITKPPKVKVTKKKKQTTKKKRGKKIMKGTSKKQTPILTKTVKNLNKKTTSKKKTTNKTVTKSKPQNPLTFKSEKGKQKIQEREKKFKK